MLSGRAPRPRRVVPASRSSFRPASRRDSTTTRICRSPSSRLRTASTSRSWAVPPGGAPTSTERASPSRCLSRSDPAGEHLSPADPHGYQHDLAVVARLHHRLVAARGLGDVPVGTVDKFQGREALVVFYSMATSSAEDMPRQPRVPLLAFTPKKTPRIAVDPCPHSMQRSPRLAAQLLGDGCSRPGAR